MTSALTGEIESKKRPGTNDKRRKTDERLRTKDHHPNGGYHDKCKNSFSAPRSTASASKIVEMKIPNSEGFFNLFFNFFHAFLSRDDNPRRVN